MKLSRLPLAVVSILLLLVPVVGDDKPAAKSDKGIDGYWLGTLTIAFQELRLGFHVVKQPDGTFKGKLDSPDQGAMGIPIDEVSFKEGVFRAESKRSRYVFEGTRNAEGTEISGKFKQSGLTIPLTLKKTDKIAMPVKRPQDPKKPYPYTEEEVTYANEKAGIKLAGTLTVPKSGSPFPAVILISGSGPQDRNETVFNHRPFLVLADYLTRKGIAVLRVDDRGVGKSTGKFAEGTSDDFAQDVLAGIEFLKGRRDIRATQIGLIGHSEGGLIAPMVATRSKDVAFIVLLAGTGLPGDEILVLQGQALLKLTGATPEQLTRQRDLQSKLFAVVKQETDKAAAQKKIDAIVEEFTAKLTEKEKQEAEGLEALAESQLKQLQGPWFRFLLNHDPRPTLQKVRCPVLALNGEKDFQVPPKENLSEIEKALKAGGNKDFTVEELPKLNHLFQNCRTGNITEYEKIEETFAPSALERIADWILKRTLHK